MSKLMAALLTLSLMIFSTGSLAQQDHSGHSQSANADGSAMQHSNGNGMSHGDGEAMGGGMMEQMHDMMHAADNSSSSSSSSSSGQAAFATIKQIVDQLQADPETNWERVNIAALREHLIDMNLVTLNAEVTTESVEGGARYFITGQGRILAAIKNMVPTHAAQVMTEIGWKTQTDTRSDGVELIVTSENPSQVVQIRALGFMGFMVQGDHHGAHHLMIAGATQGEHGNHGGGSHSEH